MGGACSMNGNDKKCTENYGRKTWREEATWETQAEDNIKTDVDWIHMAQDRPQWRALVNTVMNLAVS